jgi:hypothetical protein
MFCTLLAFVEMPIGHFWMFVKLLQWLQGVALKTPFRTNHGLPFVLKTNPL